MKAKIKVKGNKVTINYTNWPDEACKFREETHEVEENTIIKKVGTRNNLHVTHRIGSWNDSGSALLVPGGASKFSGMSVQQEFKDREEAVARAKEAERAIKLWIKLWKSGKIED